jgi:hypothetical protein
LSLVSRGHLYLHTDLYVNREACLPCVLLRMRLCPPIPPLLSHCHLALGTIGLSSSAVDPSLCGLATHIAFIPGRSPLSFLGEKKGERRVPLTVPLTDNLRTNQYGYCPLEHNTNTEGKCPAPAPLPLVSLTCAAPFGGSHEACMFFPFLS